MPKFNSTYCLTLTCCFILTIFLSCQKKKSFQSPDGYDFSSPEKFILSQSLDEISGIAFFKGDDKMLYAINDEQGRIYYSNPVDNNYSHSKFGKKKDYEDLTILDDKTVAVLKSDGDLLLFSLDKIGTEIIEPVRAFPNLLPVGEYEGLSFADKKLYVLCKNCPVDKKIPQVSIYPIDIVNDTTLNLNTPVSIDLSILQHGIHKLKFRPSAIARNPITNEWYIISSVNKMLITLNTSWELVNHYDLDPSLFKQPEGMAFNAKGDLYISNEGKMTAGNILLFKYLKH